MSRLDDLRRFYGVLGRLEAGIGGARLLQDLPTRSELPRRGVYFFFEDGETRRESGEGPRIVRVGTHALAAGSRSTLRQRLSQHRGRLGGGGNHRGSIFRLLVGEALMQAGRLSACPSWDRKRSRSQAVSAAAAEPMAAAEAIAEAAVSRYLGAMHVVWLAADDEPGPASRRGYVERNAIALLSNARGETLDAPSADWLGRASGRALVRRSGLWNQRHVEGGYDRDFVDVLQTLVD